MKYPIKDWGKGLNKDALPSELEPGFCSDATNVRFRNGFAERVNGIVEEGTGLTGPIFWCSLFQYSSATHGAYATLLTSSTANAAFSAYAYDLQSAVSEITRYTEGQTISSITRVGTTATLTTAANHGLTTGNTVSIWGASPSQYNGTYVITVTGVTTFTYTMASDPGAGASPVGLYSSNAARSLFTNSVNDPSTAPRQYSGGPFNGLFILNSPADGLYYWNGDTGTALRKIPNSYKARVSRPFGNFIFQLAPTMSGTEYPRRVLWSSSTEPGSYPSYFDASDTNDAGFVDLAEGGEVVDGLPLGDSFIVYTTDARYLFRYVGGVKVFDDPIKLPGTEGLLAVGCVTDTPVGHVFFDRAQDVQLHSGGECRNLSAGRVSSAVRVVSTGSPIYKRSFVARNPLMNEVWCCQPSDTTDIFCNRVWIWNWKDDTWGIKELDYASNVGLTAGVSGIAGTRHAGEVLYVSTRLGNSGRFGRTEADDQDFGTSFNSMVERKGMDLGDADVMKNLQRSRWNFDGTAGDTFSVQHGSSMTADGSVTYASAATYTLGTTDYVNARATAGRYLSVKVTWTTTNWSVNGVSKARSCDLDVTLGGKR